MRILKLHHPTGHPYWQANEFQITLPNGKKIDPSEHIEYKSGGYRVYHDSMGIWVQKCACGSGYGKVDIERIKPVLLVKSSEYDKIKYVGKPLIQSQELLDDIAESIR